MIKLKLKELLNERGYTQKEFSELTGLREATISELCKNSRSSLNKEQLYIVMKALELKDFNDILEVQ